jgi:hypothetical protein
MVERAISWSYYTAGATEVLNENPTRQSSVSLQLPRERDTLESARAPDLVLRGLAREDNRDHAARHHAASTSEPEVVERTTGPRISIWATPSSTLHGRGTAPAPQRAQEVLDLEPKFEMVLGV